MKYPPETGFLYSSRIITDSVQETRFLAIYIYMEYAVIFRVQWELPVWLRALRSDREDRTQV